MRWRDPRGTSWDPSASRQATWMGLACVVLTTTSITYRHKKTTTEVLINFLGDYFNFFDININL